MIRRARKDRASLASYRCDAYLPFCPTARPAEFRYGTPEHNHTHPARRAPHYHCDDNTRAISFACRPRPSSPCTTYSACLRVRYVGVTTCESTPRRATSTMYPLLRMRCITRSAIVGLTNSPTLIT